MNDLSMPEKLKKLRLASGYTQADVADKLNISRQGYQHYESGRRTPSTETLNALAEIYHIQIYDLILSDIPLNLTDIVSEDPVYLKSVAEMEQKLLKAFRKLNMQEKQILLKHAEALVWKKH